MKIGLSLGVLGPSGRDLAQGEFSFFIFAMVVCARSFAPASFLIDLSSVPWGGIDIDAGVGGLLERRRAGPSRA